MCKAHPRQILGLTPLNGRAGLPVPMWVGWILLNQLKPVEPGFFLRAPKGRGSPPSNPAWDPPLGGGQKIGPSEEISQNIFGASFNHNNFNHNIVGQWTYFTMSGWRLIRGIPFAIVWCDWSLWYNPAWLITLQASTWARSHLLYLGSEKNHYLVTPLRKSPWNGMNGIWNE